MLIKEIFVYSWWCCSVYVSVSVMISCKHDISIKPILSFTSWNMDALLREKPYYSLTGAGLEGGFSGSNLPLPIFGTTFLRRIKGFTMYSSSLYIFCLSDARTSHVTAFNFQNFHEGSTAHPLERVHGHWWLAFSKLLGDRFVL